MMIAMNKVGIDGGFWTRSHRAAFVRYPSVWNRLHVCHNTFKGPATRKGHWFVRSSGGGGGSGTTVMRGLPTRPGCREESRDLISEGRGNRSDSTHTLISDHIHPPTVFCDAHGMILHARTAPNVSENQHLDGDLGLLRRAGGDCFWGRVFGVASGEQQKQYGEGR